MTDRYLVIGNPIQHSQSPFIHSQFAAQLNADLEYGRELAELDGFTAKVRELQATGVKGINVTLPFKGEAFELADEVSERAKSCGAANTLSLRDGKIAADNTDGVGLVRDITENLDVSLAGKRILVMGAGGAVRGVLLPLLNEQPACLVLANRTVSKAEDIAAHFEQYGSIEACGYDALAGRQFDVVINGTSSSLSGEMPTLPDNVFADGSLAYDMVYGKGLTPFLAFAQGHQAAMLADGVGMLVEQAAESFYIWRGVRPDTRPVMHQLREMLS